MPPASPPTPDGCRPTGARHWVPVFAAVLAVIIYVDRVCMSQAKAFVAADLNLSNVQMGYVFSASTLAYGVFGVVGGSLGDLFGPRKVPVSYTHLLADAERAGDAADIVGDQAHNIHRPAADVFGKGLDRVEELADLDRHGQLLSKIDQAFDVGRRDWVLKADVPLFLQHMPDCQRLVHVVALDRVEKEREFVTLSLIHISLASQRRENGWGAKRRTWACLRAPRKRRWRSRGEKSRLRKA